MKMLIFLMILFMATTVSDQQKFDFEIKITKQMTLSEAAKLEEKLKCFLEDEGVEISIEAKQVQPILHTYPQWQYNWLPYLQPIDDGMILIDTTFFWDKNNLIIGE